MKCPHCNREVFPGQMTCDHCGKTINKASVKADKPEKENKNGK